MAKEFTVNLTGPQRWDLWLFLYRLNGAKPRDKDGVRNLGAVCETFRVSEVQTLVENLGDGAKLGPKDLEDVAVETGSVDLKRLSEYLSAVPEGADAAMLLRLLAISDMLDDVKNRKPRLATVPEVSP
jgi:hypothetical protein